MERGAGRGWGWERVLAFRRGKERGELRKGREGWGRLGRESRRGRGGTDMATSGKCWSSWSSRSRPGSGPPRKTGGEPMMAALSVDA